MATSPYRLHNLLNSDSLGSNAMRQRVTFQCWHCQRNYSLSLDLVGKPTLSPECPYCGKTGVVDLDPYREDKTGVFRTDAEAEQ